VSAIYDYPGAHDPATYDLENAIADPEGRIEAFMAGVHPFAGMSVADIGAGGGYHACRYARDAAHVWAIEPAPLMLRQLYTRVAGLGLTNVGVVPAGAEDLPLRDNLADVIHSRFAYFFGPERPGGPRSCEPGIREALRILKPGGVFFIIDNALTSGQFAGFVDRYAYARGQAAAMQRDTDRFYAGHGFARATVESRWAAPDRAALRQVIAMEFPAAAVDPIMDAVQGSALSYHYRVYYRGKAPEPGVTSAA
jgi:ubiquinone/menaquinone biosynthesis C-methylase UbiE